mgnify:CR=1 FL=1
MLAVEHIVNLKEGCIHFVVNDTLVEAKEMIVVNPIGRLAGFACVDSPFQPSLILHLFLDNKCHIHKMRNRMLKEPLLVASLLCIVVTLRCLHLLSRSMPHNLIHELLRSWREHLLDV